jgi:tripartite-type tricarboxylate transporter receptor subunit TctC
MDRRAFVAAGLAAGVAPARGQGAPIRFFYPYAPGSGGDLLIRFLADQIGRETNETVVVENRTGADGRIGVRDVKLAPPDGRTMLFTPFGTMVLFPSVYASLPYDVFKDFTPISQVVAYDFGLAAGPMFPGKTLADLVAWLKAEPTKANFGMPGSGAMPHFIPLQLGALAGFSITAIAYKGSVPAVSEAIAGHLPLVCAPLSDLVEQHRAGTIRLLASSGRERSPYAADVPTFFEQGYDIVASGWYAIFAPAGSPPAMVGKISSIVARAMRSEAGKSLALKLGLSPSGTTPAELGAIQKADFERWAPVVKASGFVGD